MRFRSQRSSGTRQSELYRTESNRSVGSGKATGPSGLPHSSRNVGSGQPKRRSSMGVANILQSLSSFRRTSSASNNNGARDDLSLVIKVPGGVHPPSRTHGAKGPRTRGVQNLGTHSSRGTDGGDTQNTSTGGRSGSPTALHSPAPTTAGITLLSRDSSSTLGADDGDDEDRIALFDDEEAMFLSTSFQDVRDAVEKVQHYQHVDSPAVAAEILSPTPSLMLEDVMDVTLPLHKEETASSFNTPPGAQPPKQPQQKHDDPGPPLAPSSDPLSPQLSLAEFENQLMLPRVDSFSPPAKAPPPPPPNEEEGVRGQQRLATRSPSNSPPPISAARKLAMVQGARTPETSPHYRSHSPKPIDTPRIFPAVFKSVSTEITLQGEFQDSRSDEEEEEGSGSSSADETAEALDVRVTRVIRQSQSDSALPPDFHRGARTSIHAKSTDLLATTVASYGTRGTPRKIKSESSTLDGGAQPGLRRKAATPTARLSPQQRERLMQRRFTPQRRSSLGATVVPPSSASSEQPEQAPRGDAPASTPFRRAPARGRRGSYSHSPPQAHRPSSKSFNEVVARRATNSSSGGAGSATHSPPRRASLAYRRRSLTDSDMHRPRRQTPMSARSSVSTATAETTVVATKTLHGVLHQRSRSRTPRSSTSATRTRGVSDSSMDMSVGSVGSTASTRSPRSSRRSPAIAAQVRRKSLSMRLERNHSGNTGGDDHSTSPASQSRGRRSSLSARSPPGPTQRSNDDRPHHKV